MSYIIEDRILHPLWGWQSYADAIPPYSLFLLHFGLRDQDMATITFDTLKFVEKLKASGIPDEQAKAIVHPWLSRRRGDDTAALAVRC
jgi:hypothetical protein